MNTVNVEYVCFEIQNDLNYLYQIVAANLSDAIIAVKRNSINGG